MEQGSALRCCLCSKGASHMPLQKTCTSHAISRSCPSSPSTLLFLDRWATTTTGRNAPPCERNRCIAGRPYQMRRSTSNELTITIVAVTVSIVIMRTSSCFLRRILFNNNFRTMDPSCGQNHEILFNLICLGKMAALYGLGNTRCQMESQSIQR